MTSISRRKLLQAVAVGSIYSMLPSSILRALSIPANNKTGTIKDVEHIVILMQENRSFDHYFGTLPGVRGFSDRFTIPLPHGRTVWQQQAKNYLLLPYHLNSKRGNAQRVNGTPHTWLDEHYAWDHGRMTAWPTYKTDFSMGYYQEQELPFHFSLANAFTLCDAYHCSIHTGTNPNRLFLWTGTNGPTAANVAAVLNEWDSPGPENIGYQWKTYPERLEEGGVSWKIYQYLPDNFGDNPLAGFRQYRADSIKVGNPAEPAKDFKNFIPYHEDLEQIAPLYKGNGNTLPTATSGSDLEGMLASFKADIQKGNLPQVSWLIAPAAYSEHPGPSSPVQGGWFTQEVLNSLTENPEVWSKTVLFVNYDENDGFFDHIPSPSPPSMLEDGTFAGKSTVPFEAEIFQHPAPPGSKLQLIPDNEIYGPGPRVPMFVISPWSRGGWVNSQVFDHTSVLQFIEKRFNILETNISPWRRVVCGDLTSAFNFVNPNNESLPALHTIDRFSADKLRKEQEKLIQVPIPPIILQRAPTQPKMSRPSRALPYQLEVTAEILPQKNSIALSFLNLGKQGAVFHVYNKKDLFQIPRRYSVEANNSLQDIWHATPDYDLWVLGPNGFHRHFIGNLEYPHVETHLYYYDTYLELKIINPNNQDTSITIEKCPYNQTASKTMPIPKNQEITHEVNLKSSGRWYDVSITGSRGIFQRRFAGRYENGEHSISDPLMGK